MDSDDEAGHNPKDPLSFASAAALGLEDDEPNHCRNKKGSKSGRRGKVAKHQRVASMEEAEAPDYFEPRVESARTARIGISVIATAVLLAGAYLVMTSDEPTTTIPSKSEAALDAVRSGAKPVTGTGTGTGAPQDLL